MSSHVSIEPTLVRKRGDPALLALEVAKMQQARRVGQQTGAFTVPEVIDFDATTGEVIMERIHDLTPLRALAGATNDTQALFARAGEALADVHQHLSLEPQDRHALPDAFAHGGPQSVLHGDFTKTNVGISGSSEDAKLVIIDWQMTAIHGGQASYGTPFFDVGWFVSGLFLEAPHKLSPLRTSQKADLFLNAYLEATGHARADLVTYLLKLGEVRSAWLKGHKRLGKRLAMQPGVRKMSAYFQTLSSNV